MQFSRYCSFWPFESYNGWSISDGTSILLIRNIKDSKGIITSNKCQPQTTFRGEVVIKILPGGERTFKHEPFEPEPALARCSDKIRQQRVNRAKPRKGGLQDQITIKKQECEEHKTIIAWDQNTRVF
jgi:hypothetical protein